MSYTDEPSMQVEKTDAMIEWREKNGTTFYLIENITDKDDYSVVTFQKIRDFNGDEMAQVRAYADSFKEQVKLMLEQRAENIEAEAGSGVVMEHPTRVIPENEGHFEVGAEIDGDRDELPM